ncbi:unnamed protein product [Dovyalis caffra]|uniref:Uncharacterized protein n=1 Tax=Dovyalis caffra TaxID=77055 RepID=A0AAV1RVD0_9ROSI|nr:unnamed protein product [Dovyalis caffra]
MVENEEKERQTVSCTKLRKSILRDDETDGRGLQGNWQEKEKGRGDAFEEMRRCQIWLSFGGGRQMVADSKRNSFEE